MTTSQKAAKLIKISLWKSPKTIDGSLWNGMCCSLDPLSNRPEVLLSLSLGQ